ncbi:hypothetical protein P154DRAFT_536366 [Amniculicola lignicola CBS 123094]|uniref:Uncharacterized protein n=1 Tax=Amniculicola lignicola CBS 123094 TaxID=1392246 RepID=A0A6A5WL29_9PLEO|nr:hypothetical protein P154DRAFT_536366 [Amniculicola lignicola CBS 123094]
MGALLSTARAVLNSLLPFTNQATPLIQDLIHTLILCGTLYYAPQIADYYHNRQHVDRPTIPEEPTDPLEDFADPDLPLDDRLVLQEDTDDDAIEPPLPAPTPPPFQQFEAQPPLLADEQDAWNNLLQAGPANQRDGPPNTRANRVVGPKKAKSLARKDQQRAYHEFHRQQAELRKLQEAEGKEEREAALRAERERRAEVERDIRERERLERERKKEEERKEAEEERRRRERALLVARETVEKYDAVDLEEIGWKEGKDFVWMERLVRASGLLANLQKQREGEVVMITGAGWLVVVGKEVMKEAYEMALRYGGEKKNNGSISTERFGSMLETVVRAKIKG